MTRATHGERIAALEAAGPFNQAALETFMKRIELMETHINERFDGIENRLKTQEEKLAAYENKGKGILLGVGVAGAGIGAGVFAAVEQLIEMLKI